MVHRLSWEDVLLSTLTEPSLMRRQRRNKGLMFATLKQPVVANSREEVDGRAGDGGHDEQQQHHGDGTELVRIVKRCPEETVSSPSFNDGFRFFKRRWFTAGDSFTLANFATHELRRAMGVIALASGKQAGTLIHR